MKKLSYEQIKKLFSDARKKQIESQGPITQEVIDNINNSRKYSENKNGGVASKNK
jgi:hypothetical protein